jgi:biotin transport system substrate-specific component
LSSQTQPLALADAVLPLNAARQRLARDVALVVGFALLTALFARIAIPLGFTPVPITGSTLAVLLAGAALGSRRGAAAMTLYVAAGTWLPFYATGIGPFWSLAAGGYIIGFIPAAFLVGYLAERGWDRRVWIMVAMLLGNIVIYIPGLIQLSFFVPQGRVLELGLYPFVAGDLIKIYVASLAVPLAWALLGWSRGKGEQWK